MNNSLSSDTPISYKFIKIRKHNGRGYRKIWEPNPTLKTKQRIINSILQQQISILPCIHGFVQRHSPATNAWYHVINQYWGHCDLKNFFDTITEEQVRNGLVSYGVEEPLIKVVLKWCMRFDEREQRKMLSQGIPTSPLLANVAGYQMDIMLLNISSNNNIRYSRYADDLTFSSNQFVKEPLKKEIREAIESCGFTINKKKGFKWHTDKSRAEVNGILVNNKVPTLNRDKRLAFRARLHWLKTGKTKLTLSELRKVKGYNSYIKSINPILANKYKPKIEELEQILNNRSEVE